MKLGRITPVAGAAALLMVTAAAHAGQDTPNYVPGQEVYASPAYTAQYGAPQADATGKLDSAVQSYQIGRGQRLVPLLVLTRPSAGESAPQIARDIESDWASHGYLPGTHILVVVSRSDAGSSAAPAADVGFSVVVGQDLARYMPDPERDQLAAVAIFSDWAQATAPDNQLRDTAGFAADVVGDVGRIISDRASSDTKDLNALLTERVKQARIAYARMGTTPPQQFEHALAIANASLGNSPTDVAGATPPPDVTIVDKPAPKVTVPSPTAGVSPLLPPAPPLRDAANEHGFLWHLLPWLPLGLFLGLLLYVMRSPGNRTNAEKGIASLWSRLRSGRDKG